MFERKKARILMLALLLACSLAFADGQYRIDTVEYDISGSTREFPLSQAVPIDRTRIFSDRPSLDAYVSDLETKFSNLRVLESVSIDTIAASTLDEAGAYPVSLVIHTVDTWNIIALPKPGFDSNKGFECKLKLKDYNFFGSMQELNTDVSYSLDNDGKSAFSSSLNFNIPFRVAGYAMSWNNDLSLDLPLDQLFELNIGTGIGIDIPVGFTKVSFKLGQKAVINDRNGEKELYEDDPVYLNESLSAEIPFKLASFSRCGDLVWAPLAEVSRNFAQGGIDERTLRGTQFTWGHGLSIGRYDWVGNFRKGFSASLKNTYGYNLETSNSVKIVVSGEADGFSSFFGVVGVTSRLLAKHVISGSPSTEIAEPLRGILNRRADSDSAVSLNLDVPVKVLDVDFAEITGVNWTKYIGFEMHASPFFDMMLTHDTKTGRYYDPKDGWYSGGLEVLVYLKKMRSITVRASAGYDLQDLVANGGKTRENAARDGESTYEYLIGLGLHY